MTAARSIIQMPSLEIEITFRPRSDSALIFHVTRTDGTATWQKHEGVRAAFFAMHDLSHYAVETTLSAKEGFYGLLAAGGDIDDVSGKGSKGPLPLEAVVVEHVVGLLERERSGGADPMTAVEVQTHLALHVVTGELGYVPALTDAQLNTARGRIADLHATWASHAAAGDPLVLRFRQPAISGLRMPE